MPPTEPVAGKIWKLLQKGFPMHQLNSALLLLLEIPWTSLMVEQMHASAATLTRLHPNMELEAILVRAGISGLHRLIPKPTVLERQIASLKATLKTFFLKHRIPVTGRHLYVADIFPLP